MAFYLNLKKAPIYTDYIFKKRLDGHACHTTIFRNLFFPFYCSSAVLRIIWTCRDSIYVMIYLFLFFSDLYSMYFNAGYAIESSGNYICCYLVQLIQWLVNQYALFVRFD